ncbi:ABC transporter ATP-binding protein [Amorphus sp. 3PC139-8]|uniref:ABC transporter ATP-binding protein n=1 Tax=Amorphus sp. 3PC139-8 TaxID=2735676 RepID=UPI00345C7EEB
MLAATDLTVSYGKTPVLSGLSAAFVPGRLTALVGPNGCGKSTLLKTLLGLMRADTGSVTLDGTPIDRIGRRALARRIAYLPQETHCPDYMTVGELVELGGHSRYALMGGPDARDRNLFRSALETVGLTDQAHRRVSRLSGGQRQRAWIAMVLTQDSDILLMDEPVNHLDMPYQYTVLDLVRSLTRGHGKTVVCVLHDLNLAAAFADEMVMLREGRTIAAGPTSDTITPETVRDVFSFEADIFRRHDRLVCLPHRDDAGSPAP